MDVTPLIKKGTKVIQSYAGGVFKISGQAYDHPVFVFTDHIDVWDVPADRKLAELTLDDFAPLIARSSEIDVVLLGTGANMQILPSKMRQALKEQGLSVDSMDSGAACRTYNVLMAEGRRVVCALLPSL